MSAQKTFIHFYRDNNQQVIFSDEKDYQKFISFLKGYIADSKALKNNKTTFAIRGHIYKGTPRGTQNFFNQIELLAFKLEPHRFDLVIQENVSGASQKFIRALSTRYALYFNRQHKHKGPLFTNPYSSEQIKGPDALQSLIREFHSSESSYSSNAEYAGQRQTPWIKPHAVPAPASLAKQKPRVPELILASIILLTLSTYSVTKIQATNQSTQLASTPIETPIPDVLGEEIKTVKYAVIKIDDSSPFVNIRQEAGTDSPKIGKVYDEEIYELLSENDQWYKVKLNDGTSGYISVQYAEIKNITP